MLERLPKLEFTDGGLGRLAEVKQSNPNPVNGLHLNFLRVKISLDILSSSVGMV